MTRKLPRAGDDNQQYTCHNRESVNTLLRGKDIFKYTGIEMKVKWKKGLCRNFIFAEYIGAAAAATATPAPAPLNVQAFFAFFGGCFAVFNAIIEHTYKSVKIVFISIINHFAISVILRLLVVYHAVILDVK